MGKSITKFESNGDREHG